MVVNTISYLSHNNVVEVTAKKKNLKITPAPKFSKIDIQALYSQLLPWQAFLEVVAILHNGLFVCMWRALCTTIPQKLLATK